MPRRAPQDWKMLAETLPEVQRWYRYLLKRNKDGARVNSSNLLRTLYEMKMKPADLLAMTQDELDDFMEDFVQFFQGERKLTGSTVSTYADAIKSFLAWHKRELGRPLYIEDANDNPVAEAQTIPAQDVMRSLLGECDQRTKTMVALEGFASVRPQVLGRSDGSDGLVLSDLPELVIASTVVQGETVLEVSFPQAPTPIRVRKKLSKTKKAYVTFLGPEGCEYLLDYLRSRIARGEVLTRTSPVIASYEPPYRWLKRGNIQDCIRIRMRRVSMQSSTYIHRSYFGNRLVVAESHGVPAIYREFWMGHKGGLQSRYALQKEHLPPDMLEDMRRAYSKALPYLETRRVEEPEDAIRILARQALVGSGHKEDEAAKLAANMDNAAALTVIADAVHRRQTELVPAPAQVVASGAVEEAPKKVRQQVVDVAELGGMLAQGWIVRMALGDKVVIESAG